MTENHVTASSFADPSDVRRFKRCKELGGSDENCFKIGDNGIGYWGDDCTLGSGPACALPPEVMQLNWGGIEQSKHQVVIVCRSDKQVKCIIKDIMPHVEHIHNGARIDLNADACAGLGLEPPVLTDVIWYKEQA